MSESIGQQDQSMNVSMSNSERAFSTSGAQTKQSLKCGAKIDYSIEQHLFSFANESPYSFLCSSWIIEKEAYQKRLSTIPLTFPSFSSHGDDHSKVILSRIEALLGESRIRLLSPTDAWLLLQCAYSHDIGMCVADKEKNALFRKIEENPYDYEDLLNNGDFQNYLTQTDSSSIYTSFHNHDRFVSSIRFLHQMIDRNDKEEIHKFIQQINKAEYSQAQNIFSTVTMRYFRSRHAERTRDMLIREAQDTTLNGVLPVRLRKIVAEIDYCHGTPWQEILDRLPQQDNGLYTDYIHPQFVAALLRLGDLLDLDSNRFNPFQLELIGRISKDSVVHKIKHMAITRLMIDPQWIDIEARYRYEEVYRFLTTHYFETEYNSGRFPTGEERQLETRAIIEKSANALRDWVSWLHDDLKDFSHNWNAIVPSNMSGYIAALRKNDIFMDDSKIPVQKDELELRYVISPRRASQIIEGSELYNESLAFFRELVQNSIDTTKRQIYKSIAMQHDGLEPGESFEFSRMEKDPLFQPCLKKYTVCVLLRFIRAAEGTESPKTLEITFRDYGIGITYEKLKQMRHIGAISMSREEREDLQKMPQWLQPTGEYGIGMQSVFTVVDSFRITTYPRYENNEMTNRKRTIRFSCPELGGDIVNEEEPKPAKEKMHFGTDVVVQLPLIHDTVMKLFSFRHPAEFDIRSDQILDTGVIIERIRRYILKTFTNDVVSLKFQYVPCEKITDGVESEPQLLAEFSFPEFQRNCFPWGASYLFLEDNNAMDRDPTVYFWYNSRDSKESVLLTLRNAEESQIRLYYKGIIVGNNSDSSAQWFRIPGVDVRINLMSGTAGELLEISRDYIKPTGYRLLKNLVQNALLGFYQAVYSCLKDAGADNQIEKATLYRFFSRNPEHMMCLYHVLLALKDRVDVSDFVQIFSEKDVYAYNEDCPNEAQHDDPFQQVQNPIMVYTMCILHGKMYTSKIMWHEALRWIQSDTIWFTDYRYETLFSSSIELSEGQDDVICALYDNLSDIYDMTYDKLRIIQDKTWKTQYIKLYTLTKVKESGQYPTFVREEYLRLCLIIINEYIDQYKSEKNPIRKEEIGNFILAFPATELYHALAVNQFPAEAPDKLASRYRRFIICPCKVEKLTSFFAPLEEAQITDSSTSALAYLTPESLNELFQDTEVQSFIKTIPLIQQELSPEERVKQYIRLFQDFGVFHK